MTKELKYWTRIAELAGQVENLSVEWSEVEGNYLVVSSRAPFAASSFDPTDTMPEDHRAAVFIVFEAIEAARLAGFDRFLANWEVIWSSSIPRGKDLAWSDESQEHLAMLQCAVRTLELLQERREATARG